MEKEQKRLSLYQSEQAESTGAGPEEYLMTRKTPSKDQNGNQLKCKKAAAAARKYVVDRSKPKTDLEYDPCSNFSADLRSGSSTDIKSASKADVGRDQQGNGKGKGLSAGPVPSPTGNFEDSDEEGELVIDIPPFENVESRRSLIKASDNENVMKTTKESLEPAQLDTDTPLREKKAGKPKPANKGMASINENEPSLVTDLSKRRHTPLPKGKSSSERAPAVRSIPTEGEQKSSVRPRMAMEESESSKRMMEIDAPPAENNQALHKSLNLASTKNDQCKEEVLNYATEGATELPENGRLTGFSQVCQLDKPPPAKRMNVGVCVEKAQTTETVLDNISICLDHLRRESESIACLQDVDDLLDAIHSAPSCSKVHEDHLLQPSTQRLLRQTGPEVQPSNCLSGHIKKIDTFPLRHSSEIPRNTEVFQDYLPTTSSIPDITKGPGSYPNSPTSVKTNWPFPHKFKTEPVVENAPLYVSEASTAINPGATSMDLEGDQNLQKPPALLGATDEKLTADSSASEELNYSDLDLSESDPMEECYRIFMEANKAEDPTVQGDMPVSG